MVNEDKVTYKGPAYGIYVKYEDIVFGQLSLKDIDKDTPITWDVLGGING